MNLNPSNAPQVLPESPIEDLESARLIHFGTLEYGTALELQEHLRAARLNGETPDCWLFGDHPTVITQGARGKKEDVLTAAGPAGGIPIFQIDRGGMTTLHSPGQLIIYPIVQVRGGSLSAGRLARSLIEAMRLWVKSEFGVDAENHPGAPGLYVGDRKLLSVGISVRQGVSMHGVAINLCNDLSLWSRIVACGAPGVSPISLSELLDRRVEPASQGPSLSKWLGNVWVYGRVVSENV